MRTVALEEHFSVPHLARRIDPSIVARRGYRPRTAPPDGPNPLELMTEIGERRLKSMDETGITVQVLSITGPGPDLLSGADGVSMAREFLDHPSYDGLFAAAVELDVPIYIHPHIPPEPVRQAYFSDLPAGASRVLETAGWGWHSETAVHLLR